MANFILSPTAKADLENIWDYTAKEWGSAQAEHYTRNIEAACVGLAAGSQISHSAQDIRADYRKALIGSHVLFFKVLKDGTIDIIRILHQRMDISRHFP